MWLADADVVLANRQRELRTVPVVRKLAAEWDPEREADQK
jgi:hypothetical protein